MQALPAGAELREATTVREATDLAEEFRPDVVFIDRGLPDGDGLRLVPILREHDVLAAVLILVLTAGFNEAERALVLNAGADEYLSKSLELDDLRGLSARIERLAAMAPEARVLRRAELASRHQEGEQGDLDPPALPARKRERPPRRRWWRDNRDD